ncbi:hypothetical protein GCM10010211_33200 [Streptomyces albospinus]|uniref:Uncharacterized protein n=1 Tax=Streptomyces albospinus TaxID=285515 RepID=A0ABQ2V308_9ACTN|nr:hypothetical protein [Streptomyces albospinus]GGU65427.1 hypothetical protein GCM10010211_33200 [Streptomyces albospinus]
MSLRGTDAYQDQGWEQDQDFPALVQRAVRAARRHGFAYSCRPEQGRLLRGVAVRPPVLLTDPAVYALLTAGGAAFLLLT